MPEAEDYRDDGDNYILPQGVGVQVSDDFFKFRIDGLDVVEELQHQLRGEVYDTDKKRYVKKFDRVVNERGINKITHLIYGLGINKNTLLGCLDREQIMYKCAMLKRYLAKLILLKSEDYEIDRTMWDLLVTMVVNNVHSALSRSEFGREANQLSTAHSRTDAFVHNDNEKAGLMDRILNRRKY